MNTGSHRVDALDVSLFDRIPSQTSLEDRRVLLAVQRVTAQKRKYYTYLEIGAHLGGSLQPHLIDERCTRIYSIDSRPASQPDERNCGTYVAHYSENSTERMLGLLAQVGHGDTAKIICFERRASEIDSQAIHEPPHIVFIDGEHTHGAVLADFRFCDRVINSGGTILFHDFSIVYRAILEVCRRLDKELRPYRGAMLGGNVFALFLDPELPRLDPYLSDALERNKHALPLFLAKQRLKQLVPMHVRRLVRRIRAVIGT